MVIYFFINHKRPNSNQLQHKYKLWFRFPSKLWDDRENVQKIENYNIQFKILQILRKKTECYIKP